MSDREKQQHQQQQQQQRQQQQQQQEEDTSFETNVRATFQRLDLDGNSQISVDELAQALHVAKVPTSHVDIERLHHDMDLNHDGSVSQDEFVSFALKRRDVLWDAFMEICRKGEGAETSSSSGNGDIVIEPTTKAVSAASFHAGQLRRAAEKSGVALSDKDVQTIMHQLDENKDGSVTFEEFISYLLLVPNINPHVFLDRWFVDVFVDDAQSDFTFPREIRRKKDEEELLLRDIIIQKLVCGATAGCLSRTLTAPVDRIRLLMMTSKTRMGMVDAYSVAVSHPRGFRALWIGNGVNCIKIAPEMAIKLLAFDLLKHAVAADPDNITTIERFVAGGTAGALAEFSIYPLDVIRTRLATAPTGMYYGIADCARTVFGTGGTGALYAGIIPSILGIIPYAAVDLTVNSLLRDMAASRLQAKGQEASVPLLLGCGMASSATATVLTFPLNVIRTQAQATGTSVGSVFQAVKSEGIRGFYRGVVPCLFKVMPATSISYASYEWFNAQWSSHLR